MKILYLYSEVMGYTLAVIKSLVQAGCEVDVVYWDHNKKTPFVPPAIEGVVFYKRSECTRDFLEEKINTMNPALMYVSGRMDSLYLEICLYARLRKIKVVSGFDNQWKGTVKNRLSLWLSHYLYKRYFDFIWVPGIRQYEYAKRLGYSEHHIIFNLYCADKTLYYQPLVRTNIRKRFLFVGRYAQVKGIDRLVEQFSKVKGRGWKLILIGNGPLRDTIPVDSDIEVIDFMPPAQLASFIQEGGVFVLPSYHEPWGVVLHEFAYAGFPIICSDSCGASTRFVVNSYNGWVFDSSHSDSLGDIMKHVTEMNETDLLKMGERSKELALSITPELSAHSLLSVLKRN